MTENFNPAVSVIVPCRNERDHIENCVRSILAQVPPPGDFEVIVADGMSDDGTRDILRRMAAKERRLMIVDNTKYIVSAGLNTAIRAARGNIILRMDAHTEYSPNYIEQCLIILSQTGADNVGGPARTKGGSYIQCAICAAYHSPFAVGGARFHDVNYEGYVDTVPYGCWTRDVFERIGLFDETLVRNQDDEFNLRLVRAGGKIWQSPRIQSWYRPRASLRMLIRQYAQYGYWKVAVMKKHHRPASLRHLVPGGFILCLILLPLCALFYPALFVVWLALLLVYAFGILLASVTTAARCSWRLTPVLPLVFSCYHLGYGMGFLYGVMSFLILRRAPLVMFTSLTRSSR